jgi:predicted ArsR family transcriptional regulator
MDLLGMPDDARRLLQLMIRHGDISLAEAASYLEKDESSTRHCLEQLVKQGYIQEVQVVHRVFYRIEQREQAPRRRTVGFWALLDEVRNERQRRAS